MAGNNSISVIFKTVFITIVIWFVVFILILSENPDKVIKDEAIQKKDAAIQNKDNNKQIEKRLFPKFDTSKLPVTPNMPPFSKYKFIYTYTINVLENISNVELLIPLPVNENEKQYISDFLISPKPSFYSRVKGNLIAKYNFKQLKPGQYDIIINGTAHVRTYNIKTAKKLNKNITPAGDITKYIQPERAIESDDNDILGVANSIDGYTKEEIIENVYKYIQDNMTYRITADLASAKQALINRYGKCSEYSSVMVALLRARGIPSRVVMGNIAREFDNQHNWVEVYFDEYGWVSYDPTVAPSVVKIHAPNGKLLRIEKQYDVSHDDIKYIKSGINAFSPYYLRYDSENQSDDIVYIKQNIDIINEI